MKLWLSILFALLVIALSGGLVYWRQLTLAPDTNSNQNIRLVIAKGMSAGEVGYKLAQLQLVKSPLAFKIYVLATGKAKAIQAGEYLLPGNLDLPALLAEIQKGPTQVWITIPEGLRHEEIGLKLANGIGLTGTQYRDFVLAFIQKAKSSEGYLFPDTYLLPKDITPTKAVDVMLGVFGTQTANLRTSDNLARELIVASLVEREARTDAERPVIAGIIYKRLDNDWPLQIDASLQYAVATASCTDPFNCKFWTGLTKADLGINSSYNTYTKLGLPPAPICNPGLASIKAAVSPTASDYWFYLHDPQGGIHYAETIEEHNANVRQYLGK